MAISKFTACEKRTLLVPKELAIWNVEYFLYFLWVHIVFFITLDGVELIGAMYLKPYVEHMFTMIFLC